jgi:RNA polymerase sigma-54 factor
MSQNPVVSGRMTANLDGEFVVFLIGMRINRPWKVHKWWPVFVAMPRMIRRLSEENLGLLSHHVALRPSGPILVQYWRSADQLQRFARDALLPHLAAWRMFNRKVGYTDDRVRLARAVIADHLPALAKGHFSAIATALGTSRTEIRRILEMIRERLRPYPVFHGNRAATASYLVPDVVVREHDDISGEFTVELVEPALTRLAVWAGRRRRDANGSSVPQARSFVAQLHDRWETLRQVAEYAIQRQKEFLVRGAAALGPLTRTEVAGALGLHESTVSRAVADKYVLLPDHTIVALARFFGAGGGIHEELRKLLESSDTPMSDQRLADLLRDAGYPIARRTVTKHRARLGFTAASLR